MSFARQLQLHDIIDRFENDYFIYLKSSLDWELLNNSHKLNYGCTMTFDGIKRAENQAFTMENCELTELHAEGYDKGDIEISTEYEVMIQKNLLFTANINVKSFVKLGISGKIKKYKSPIQNKSFLQLCKVWKSIFGI